MCTLRGGRLWGGAMINSFLTSGKARIKEKYEQNADN